VSRLFAPRHENPFATLYFVTVTIPNIHLASEAVKSCRPVSYIEYPGAVLAASGVAHLTTEDDAPFASGHNKFQDRNSQAKIFGST